MGKLTAVAVKAANKPGRYQDGAGLMLVVKESGARSWVLRIQADGKRRDVGVGSAADVTLAVARDKAVDLRKLYRAGRDPLADRRADKLRTATIPIFRDAAITTHKENAASWRNVKHRADWLSSLERYAFPAIGDVRVDRIEAVTVRDVLLPIWLERPETARRVMQRIKMVLSWAASNKHCAALAFDRKTLSLPRQPQSDGHFKAMPYGDVPAFAASLSGPNETVSRLALQFLILTAARSGEVRGAAWSEIDLKARTWTLPANRMKAGKAHVVPLSDAALAVLDHASALRRDKDTLVFPAVSGRPLSDMTLLKVMRDRELPFSVHGFRSAFKTWAVEATSFPDAVSEAALAHIDANKVRAAYSRTDFRQQRTDQMAAWANFIGGSGGTVHALRPAAKVAA